MVRRSYQNNHNNNSYTVGRSYMNATLCTLYYGVVQIWTAHRVIPYKMGLGYLKVPTANPIYYHKLEIDFSHVLL